MLKFSNLQNYREVINNKTNTKVLGNFKLGTPTSLDINEILALKGTAFAYTKNIHEGGKKSQRKYEDSNPKKISGYIKIVWTFN